MKFRDSCLALCLAGATAFLIMTHLGTPMVANTVWTVTPFHALRVLKYASLIQDFLKAISAAFTAVVATTVDFGAWIRATEDRGRDIFETVNLNGMAALRHSLFDLDAAFNDFQVGQLMAKDILLDMTTMKLYALNFDHARATIFAT